MICYESPGSPSSLTDRKWRVLPSCALLRQLTVAGNFPAGFGLDHDIRGRRWQRNLGRSTPAQLALADDAFVRFVGTLDSVKELTVENWQLSDNLEIGHHSSLLVKRGKEPDLLANLKFMAAHRVHILPTIQMK
jgi:hypothetical protein